MAKKTVAAKKRNVKVDANGQLHVHSSFNNIIVSLANSEGQIISWSSAGKMGFRGSKKNTPYAAQMAAQDCAKVAYDLGLRKVKAYVKGPGNGRESAISMKLDFVIGLYQILLCNRGCNKLSSSITFKN